MCDTVTTYQKKSNEPAEALQHQSMCASAMMLSGIAKDGDTIGGILWRHTFLVQKQVDQKKRSSLQNEWVFGPNNERGQRK